MIDKEEEIELDHVVVRSFMIAPFFGVPKNVSRYSFNKTFKDKDSKEYIYYLKEKTNTATPQKHILSAEKPPYKQIGVLPFLIQSIFFPLSIFLITLSIVIYYIAEGYGSNYWGLSVVYMLFFIGISLFTFSKIADRSEKGLLKARKINYIFMVTTISMFILALFLAFFVEKQIFLSVFFIWMMFLSYLLNDYILMLSMILTNRKTKYWSFVFNGNVFFIATLTKDENRQIVFKEAEDE